VIDTRGFQPMLWSLVLSNRIGFHEERVLYGVKTAGN